MLGRRGDGTPQNSGTGNSEKVDDDLPF